MNAQSFDLEKLPNNEQFVPGYKTILAAWKKLFAVLDANGSLTEAELNTAISEAKNSMTLSERKFFDDRLTQMSSLSVRGRQAKLTAVLNIVLMARHGFNVSREDGGLG